MKLHKIIGQLFIIGFQGESLKQNRWIEEDITKRNLGGVILFDRFLAGNRPTNNIVSPSQLKLLTSELQQAAKESSNRLFISIDQEGGKVCRLKQKYGFPAFQTPFEICEKNDKHFSRRQAELVATTLKEAGINFNFAPVADLNSNPDNPVIGKLERSYSAEPEKVTEQCEIWLESHRKHGVLGCLKHFPGHGSSIDDSHLGFVDISDSWNKNELLPYKELIRRKKVDAIMLGHLFHSGLDSEFPASLSSKIIGQMLRDDLKFDGVVLTDDLQMKAITERFGLRQTIIRAISAGVDLLIFGNNLVYDRDICKKAISYVEEAIENNELSIDTVMAAYDRVQNLKQNLPL